MDVLAWSGDRPLGWDDFQAEFSPAAPEDAHSAIRFRPAWTVDSDSLDGKIVFRIRDLSIHAEFHPLLSWVRPTEATDGLLAHEQGRFDLAELVAREMAPAVQEEFGEKAFPTRGKNEEQRRQLAKEDSGGMILPQMEAVGRAFEGRSAEYDRKTDFGRNASSQSEYDSLFGRLRP